MGAGVSASSLKGKSREELLWLAYAHIDRGEEEKVTLGDLMCMADELSPAEIENIRSDFVRIDRHDDGNISKEDYTTYYIAQLGKLKKYYNDNSLENMNWKVLFKVVSLLSLKRFS
jgi:hypothetical protein